MLGVSTTFKVAPSAPWTLSGRALRWLAPAWTMLPLAARLCRVRNPLNGAIAELTADQYAILTACEGCKTLDEHGVTVRRKLGVPDQDWPTISRWLVDFVSHGLFVSLDDLTNRLKPKLGRSTAPFAGVVIRTSDRPELLARVLKSAAVLERRSQSRYPYQVLDDSRDQANIAANRNTVAECGLDCIHHDLSREHPVVTALRASFPAAREEIAWLFGTAERDEVTYGRPVNFAMLLTAGRRLLMLDDDALLDARAGPSATSGLEVSSSSDELFCFESYARLEEACSPIDVDPIAAHLEVIGADVCDVWAKHAAGAYPAPIELTGGDGLRFTSDARVIVTQNHAIGDPGSSLFPYHLLTLPVTSRQQLLGTPLDISVAFRDRYNWRGHMKARLTPNRPLTLTTLAGLDNSALLPPTVRSHRNEDLLLGDVIRYSNASAWSFDLPWGLPHRRQYTKQWLDATAIFAQEPVHFLLDFLEQRASTIVSDLPTDRMRGLAAALLDLSAASNEHMSELLEAQAADTASRVRHAIQGQLDDPTIPATWKQALPKWLGSPTLSMDSKVLQGRCAPAGLVRDIAKHYGKALEIWPDLWAWSVDRT